MHSQFNSVWASDGPKTIVVQELANALRSLVSGLFFFFFFNSQPVTGASMKHCKSQQLLNLHFTT